MAFCGKCGTELQEGMSFCANCGNRVNNSNLPVEARTEAGGVVQQSFDLRRQSLEEMLRLIQYFSKKAPQYDEYERLNTRLIELDKDRFLGLRKLGQILLAIFSPFIAIFLIFYFSQRSELKADPDYSITEVIVAFAIIGVILLICIWLITLPIFDRKKRREEAGRIIMRQVAISGELGEYYREFGPCIVGYEYTNPRVLQMIAQTIENGRADTPKEAINRLLEDAHRTSVELQMQITAEAATRAAVAAEAAASRPIYSPTIFIFRG